MVRVLVVLGVFAVGCGSPPPARDVSVADAPTPDATTVDATTVDATTVDASRDVAAQADALVVLRALRAATVGPGAPRGGGVTLREPGFARGERRCAAGSGLRVCFNGGLTP